MESSSKIQPFKAGKLPSFGGKKEEERKGGAVVPIGGAATEIPNLRAGRKAGAATLLGRAKNLKPHELAFAGAGLAVLLLAPFLDYLVSSPEDSATLAKGFNAGGAMFDPGDTAEIGMNAIARGGAVSGKEESLITPLDHPDPLNLIMVRDSGKEKEAGKIEGASTEKTEPAPEPPASNESWKDAITAAKASVKQAVSRAPGLPRPTGKLEGQLRGLAALQSGGTAATAAAIKLDAPAASKNLVGSPNQSGSLSRVSVAKGFRGVASGSGVSGSARPTGGASGASSSSSLLEPVPGSGASNFFSGRPGSVAQGDANLNPASSQTSPGTKTTTPATTENLALLKAKMEMEKKLALKYDKKKYDQIERKKMFEQIATQTAFQTAQQVALKLLDKALNPNGQQQQQGQGQGGNGAVNGAPVNNGAGILGTTIDGGAPRTSVTDPRGTGRTVDSGPVIYGGETWKMIDGFVYVPDGAGGFRPPTAEEAQNIINADDYNDRSTLRVRTAEGTETDLGRVATPPTTGTGST